MPGGSKSSLLAAVVFHAAWRVRCFEWLGPAFVTSRNDDDGTRPYSSACASSPRSTHVTATDAFGFSSGARDTA